MWDAGPTLYLELQRAGAPVRELRLLPPIRSRKPDDPLRARHDIGRVDLDSVRRRSTLGTASPVSHTDWSAHFPQLSERLWGAANAQSDESQAKGSRTVMSA